MTIIWTKTTLIELPSDPNRPFLTKMNYFYQTYSNDGINFQFQVSKSAVVYFYCLPLDFLLIIWSIRTHKMTLDWILILTKFIKMRRFWKTIPKKTFGQLSSMAREILIYRMMKNWILINSKTCQVILINMARFNIFLWNFATGIHHHFGLWIITVFWQPCRP